ncbi:peptidase M23 [Micromonospora sp. HM5-17]|uniref:peptidase M23 n=1 Tax=Micromonospora sp. HM5-17 TaxID=2487710 RepID=UPI001F407D6A|nr:peptidase M23 [Micromonospora sp. HM5-17]
MRDDAPLNDRHALDDTADRSDDVVSADQNGGHPAPVPARRSGLTIRSAHSRFLRNPFSGRSGRTRLVAAAGAVCALGLIGWAQIGIGSTPGDAPAPDLREEIAQRAEPDAASRGKSSRSASPTTQAPSADTSPPPARKAKPKPKSKPKPITPVAGLDKAQMGNAVTIVRTGQEMRVPHRALVIAVATAMQESNLYNYASGVLPESQNYPHQAIGWDHDSVGLFQQRPSTGWGPVRDLMSPRFATRQFLTALQKIPGWQDLPLTVAAQAVQVSAYPGLYAQHEWQLGDRSALTGGFSAAFAAAGSTARRGHPAHHPAHGDGTQQYRALQRRDP